jgi:hypothetical protein
MNRKMLRLIILGLALVAMVALDFVPVAEGAEAGATITLAQNQRPQRQHRTLFDLLFGGKQQEQARPQQQAPVRRAPRKTAPAASLPPPPPPKATVEKAATATRLAVFGDSLAVDLAGALERFYAEDPNLIVIDQGVGSSGFVRDDYFDWNQAIKDAIAANSFDVAVIIIGINDRQPMRVDGESVKPLTEAWSKAYSDRISAALTDLRNANKPVVWVGLPPMSGTSYSTAMTQISSIQRLASFAAGAEFLDIFEKFADENGKYTSYGPDINGQQVRMRKDDGIHFSAAGADKLAFYVSEEIKPFYHGGGIAVAVADPLSGTDAQAMLRPPYQGLGQLRLLEVAGAVLPLNREPPRAGALVTAASAANGPPFDLNAMMQAPMGRADAFGVGIDPSAETDAEEANP